MLRLKIRNELQSKILRNWSMVKCNQCWENMFLIIYNMWRKLWWNVSTLQKCLSCSTILKANQETAFILYWKCLDAHTMCANFGLNAHSLGNSLIFIWRKKDKTGLRLYFVLLNVPENRFSVSGNRFLVPAKTLFSGYAGPSLVTLVHWVTLVH